MSRQETQIIKGIALLMMLWLHLFMKADQTLALNNLVFIGDIPLATLITRACPPVGFFVFCGGYGLYYTYRKGNDKHYLSRIIKLFIAYWLVLLICVPLCIYLAGVSLKTDMLSMINNITALKVSWDDPAWFLFPYALLSLSYPLLFPIYDKVRVRYILPLTFCLGYMSMAILHLWGSSYLREYPYLSIPVCYILFLFLFFCGATVLRCDLLTKVRKAVQQRFKVFRLWQILGILTIVIMKILLKSGADGGIYTLAIIFMFLAVPLNPQGIVAKFLEKIGSHSMNMWIVHFFLYTYLLHDIIYGLRYPILIFIGLIIVSYISSVVMNVVLKPIYKILKLT